MEYPISSSNWLDILIVSIYASMELECSNVVLIAFLNARNLAVYP